ncbi:MAG: hypothetical protein HQ518_28960 [Rhodopirellula sp.]|nr:hypothetical protein [Rhodopirellula sp.]
MIDRIHPLAQILIIFLIAGCSDRPETHLVHGMVVYPDGMPLIKGTVEFETLNGKTPITATGEIAPDGTFQLGTFEAKDGAIAGQHRVAVIADNVIGTEAERPELLPPPILNTRFSDFKTSELEFTVKPSMNNLLIEVDYPPTSQTGTGNDQIPTPLGTE